MTCKPIIVSDYGMRELELYSLVQQKQREYADSDLDKFFKTVILSRLKEIKDMIKTAVLEQGLFSEQIEKPAMDANTIRKLACYFVDRALDIIRRDIDSNDNKIVKRYLEKGWRMMDFMAMVERDAIMMFCESLYPAIYTLTANAEYILYIMHCEVSNQVRSMLCEHDINEAAHYLPVEFVANNITPYYQ